MACGLETIRAIDTPRLRWRSRQTSLRSPDLPGRGFLCACSEPERVSLARFASTVDDGFTAYDEQAAATGEGTTYVMPGEIIFEGSAANPGFVGLCHYPDEFLMVAGGLLVEDGARGIRLLSSDGQNGLIMAVDSTWGAIYPLPNFDGSPKSLYLGTGAGLVLAGVPESQGTMRVILNGRAVRIAFAEDGP